MNHDGLKNEEIKSQHECIENVNFRNWKTNKILLEPIGPIQVDLSSRSSYIQHKTPARPDYRRGCPSERPSEILRATVFDWLWSASRISSAGEKTGRQRTR